MQDPASFQLPFTNRDQLRFEEGVMFGLRLQVQASNSSTLTIRGFTRSGVFTFSAVTAATSLLETFNFRLPDIPIMVSVVDGTNSLIQGTCYATLFLTLNNDIAYSLCCGMVFARRAISYPVSGNELARPSAGVLRSFNGTDPAAGAEVSQTVTAGQLWNIKSVVVTLVTDANVANRRVHIVFRNGGGETVRAYATIDQAASTTVKYIFAHYGYTPDETDTNTVLINIPDNVFLESGSDFITATTNIQVGDNFGAPRVTLEHWFYRD